MWPCVEYIRWGKSRKYEKAKIVAGESTRNRTALNERKLFAQVVLFVYLFVVNNECAKDLTSVIRV